MQVFYESYIRFFRLKGYRFEYIQTSISVLILLFFSFFGVIFLLIIIPISDPQIILDIINLDFWNETSAGIIAIVITLFMYISSFLLFYFTKSVDLLVFFFNASTTYLIYYFHFVDAINVGIYEGGSIILMIIPICVCYVLGKYSHFLFWVAIFFITLGLGCIRDIILMDTERVVASIEKWGETTLKFVYFFMYFCVFANTLFVSFVLLVSMFQTRSKRSVIEKVGMAILNLDFDDKFFVELKKKSVKYCNDTERLLKGIIENLEIYKKHLPDSILQANEGSEKFVEKIEEIKEEQLSDTDSSDGSSNESSGDRVHLSSDMDDSSASSRERKIIDDERMGKLIKKRIVDFNLRCKKDTVVIVFRIKFMGLSNEDEGIKNAFDTMKSIHEIISSVVYCTNGTVNDISCLGDRIIVSYNIIKRCVGSGHRAWEAIRSLKKSIDKKSEFDGVSVIANAVKGTVTSGNIKTKRHIKFFLLPEKLQVLNFMESLKNKLLDTKFYLDERMFVLINEDLFGQGKYLNEMIQIESFNGEKIYRCGRNLREKENKEWNYEIGNIHISEPTEEINDMWELFRKNKKKELEEKIEEFENKYVCESKFLKFLKEKMKFR